MPGLYLDTNSLIYLFEGNAQYGRRVERIIADYQDQNQPLLTATLTNTEFLAGNDAAPQTLEQIDGLQFIALSQEIAQLAGKLRRQTGLRLGDAVHLATALYSQTSELLSNDKRFIKVARNFVPIIEA